MDCFAGAGTTLLVAGRLQRDAIGIELNVAYTQMAMDRVRADAPLFADMADAPVPEPPEDARMGDLFDMAADWPGVRGVSQGGPGRPLSTLALLPARRQRSA